MPIFELQKELFDAINVSDRPRVEVALARGASLHEPLGVDPEDGEFDGNYPIHAIRDASFVYWFKELDPEINWSQGDHDGDTLLHLIFYSSDMELFEAVLSTDIDVNAPDSTPKRQTALHKAMSSWGTIHAPVMDMLLAKEADTTIEDAEGYLPVTRMLKEVQVGISLREKLDIAVKHGVNLSARTKAHGCGLDVLVNNDLSAERENYWRLIYGGCNPHAAYGNDPDATPYNIAVEKDIRGALQAFKEFNRIPSMRETSAARICHEELLRTNEHDYCYLDNPLIWQVFHRIEQLLEEKGEHLTLEDMLSQNPNGEFRFEVAAKCGKLGELCNHLAKYGEVLAPDFRDPEMAGALATCVQKGQLRHLFAPMPLQASAAMQLRASFRSLPEEVKQSLPNAHVIAAKLRNVRCAQEI